MGHTLYFVAYFLPLLFEHRSCLCLCSFITLSLLRAQTASYSWFFVDPLAWALERACLFENRLRNPPWLCLCWQVHLSGQEWLSWNQLPYPSPLATFSCCHKYNLILAYTETICWVVFLDIFPLKCMHIMRLKGTMSNILFLSSPRRKVLIQVKLESNPSVKWCGNRVTW